MVHDVGERDVLVSGGEYQEVEIGNGTFYIGDCFDVMRDLPDGSVDMVLCDLPYGTTQNKWDSVLPFDRLWGDYWRVGKSNAAVVLTAAQPFTSVLAMSQINRFKYDWVWRKSRPSGHLNAKKMPMRDKEDILVFYRSQPVYNPIMTKGAPNHVNSMPRVKSHSDNYGKQYEVVEKITDDKYPRQVQDFVVVSPTDTIHPTQKPVALFEYLIRTYTNEDMVVLDNTAGSGTTAIAAENAGRRWICIERDPEYAGKAIERIRTHVEQKNIIPFHQPKREVVPLFIPGDSPLWWSIAV